MMDKHTEEIQLPELETRCPDCEGRGCDEERGRWCPCNYCDGAGSLLTEAGEKVFNVMRNRFDFLLRRAIEDGTLSLRGR
jgi:DnaJ-class molecular chaperone